MGKGGSYLSQGYQSKIVWLEFELLVLWSCSFALTSRGLPGRLVVVVIVIIVVFDIWYLSNFLPGLIWYKVILLKWWRITLESRLMCGRHKKCLIPSAFPISGHPRCQVKKIQRFYFYKLDYHHYHRSILNCSKSFDCFLPTVSIGHCSWKLL